MILYAIWESAHQNYSKLKAYHYTKWQAEIEDDFGN